LVENASCHKNIKFNIHQKIYLVTSALNSTFNASSKDAAFLQEIALNTLPKQNDVENQVGFGEEEEGEGRYYQCIPSRLVEFGHESHKL